MKKKTHAKNHYNDIALQLAHKLFGLEYLHYGYFTEDMPISIQSLPLAQNKYLEKILDQFPQGVKKVLDIGCGVGGVAEKLLKRGYEVTCLDPDPFMVSKTLERNQNKVKAFNDFYENIDFLEPQSFDLVLMSESCQYIDPTRGWQLHSKHLKPSGYVVIADFFKIKPIDKPYLSKSGHDFEEFLKIAQTSGFQLLNQIDITPQVAPTMDIYQDIILNKIFPVIEALFEVVRRRFPPAYRVLEKLFKEKIIYLKEKYSHQGAQEFAQYKGYYILVFQNNAGR